MSLLSTNLPKSEVLRILEEVTLSNLTNSKGEKKLFSGCVDREEFYVRRKIAYRNSFLPEIHGVVENKLTGSEITLEFNMHQAIMIFAIIWIGGLTFWGILMTISTIQNGEWNVLLLLPFAMLAFGFLVINGTFHGECTQAEKAFIKLWKAKLV